MWKYHWQHGGFRGKGDGKYDETGAVPRLSLRRPQRIFKKSLGKLKVFLEGGRLGLASITNPQSADGRAGISGRASYQVGWDSSGPGGRAVIHLLFGFGRKKNDFGAEAFEVDGAGSRI